MVGEALGEGRMHARWATCSRTSRGDLRQTVVSARRRLPEDAEPGKAMGECIRRGRRKKVEMLLRKSAG